jgi:hypothetical protein
MNVSEKKEREEDPQEWMLRPCVIYKDEYDDCTSIQARFNQYFIFGQTLKCDQWKTDYHNCYQWQKNNSKEAYNKLIESEKKRRMERLTPHYQNNVWERRKKPPENWNAPLPEWMQKEFENSYLHIRNQEMKMNKENSVLNTKCTIM